MSEFLTWLGEAAATREARGLRRSVTPVKGGDVLDLAGNDYLGLRAHPAVVAGAITAAETYGGGAGASRLVTGTLPVHEDVEEALTALTGMPSALTFSTGYQANLSAVTSLTDADTLIVSDAHVHASLVDGCRLSRARVSIARHNDVAHVAELLAGRTERRALVVVESVYSVLGDAAPLAAVAEVADRHRAAVVVDEAHGLGVVGDRGQGLAASLGLAGADHVVLTATLSKSFAAQGGAVLGHPAVREHLANTARPFIYDTGLAPASAGAALGALGVLTEHPHLAADVRRHAAGLARACAVEPPAGAVLSVAMPGPREALAAADEALRDGVRIGCFRPPSTPDGSSRLRLTAHADHSADDVDRVASLLRRLTRA